MWWDSYPYSTLSVHALHPQYLALRATVDDIEGASMPPDISAEIENARVQLDGPDVDYEGTMATKKRLCRKIFDAVGHKTLQTQAYKVGLLLLGHALPLLLDT
eukprot:GHUV01037833.1.p1 GENE.GHUV01037833.1~~GHUV01037833.1.p1  ORF type:complete len:103 (-),score=11.02 GHUV01037833.1:380-688(-)